MCKVNAQPDGKFIYMTPATDDFKPKRMIRSMVWSDETVGLNLRQIRSGAEV